MNLRSIANRSTSRVNPNVSAQIYKSAGETTSLSGKQSASFSDPITVMVQKQAITQSDLKHLDNINMDGVFTSIYVNDSLYAMDRGANKGGDKIVIGSDTWLVVAVPEHWSNWVRVIGCLQLT